MKEAASKALDGDQAAVTEFLRHGQYRARETDDDLQTTQVMAAGGPEVKTDAQIALDGTPQMRHDFLATGQYRARLRDQARDAHHASIDRLVADASQSAALAQQQAAEAAQAAAVARHAAQEAAGYAERARQSADRARGYAADAARSADAAGKSAAAAAESARIARNAAARATADAKTAANAAQQAAASAAQARSAAASAAAAADRARRAALDAGKDAADARRAASEAIQAFLGKYQAEQAHSVPNGSDRSGGLGINQYESGTYVLRLDGVCYLNGVQLPSKNKLGTGSCDGLAHDFDIWVTDLNVRWSALPEGLQGAKYLLAEYCAERPAACGPDLIATLPFPDRPIIYKEMGFGNFLGKIFRGTGGVIARGSLPEALGPANSALYRQMTEILGTEMSKPFVNDPDLARMIDNLWRSNAGFANGSTAAAARAERALGKWGIQIKGADHVTKAKNYIVGLEKWLKNRDSELDHDAQVVRNVLRDLKDAVGE
ncbi:ALF repeat-containing protein [Amycolatopsis sulphurea]|nr:ALF repeat-containing protein [Amycolatopsis sulphurea]